MPCVTVLRLISQPDRTPIARQDRKVRAPSKLARRRSREYNWTGVSAQRTLLGKAARISAQFTPHSWDERDWRVFSSPARCLQCLVPIAVVLTMEV